jgi:hypothetical protein
LRGEWIASDEEPQASLCPMTGIFHTHSCPFDYSKRLGLGRFGYIEIVTDQVVSVQVPINVHRTAEKTWALTSAADIHHRLDSAQ